MKTNNFYHNTVLLKEAIDLLNVRPGGKYIDCTLGGGGHGEEIIKRGGELLGIDVDPQAIEFARGRFGGTIKSLEQEERKVYSPKLNRDNFVNIDKISSLNDFIPADGILLDLGVSSHQLETSERGFSFNLEGDLDMRMDPDLSVSAKELVNGLSEKELAELFEKLGEEKYARRYSRTIVEIRQKGQIQTCSKLAEVIVSKAPPQTRFDRIHPATRVFQALRIAVNDELNNLREVLPKALKILDKSGRLVVISFHSLEDGIVKEYFSANEKNGSLKIITKKPVEPSREEVKVNPRSRSAKLRAVEKI